MHVLVTGAGGFSGSHLVTALLGAGHRVVAVVGRSLGRLHGLDDPRLDVISADLSQGAVAIPPGTDMVVHAAARSPGPGLTVTTADFIRDNVLATERLADAAAAANVAKFVYFSSISVFGRVCEPILSEANPVRDPDGYGLSKRLGELSVAERGFASLAVRLPGVIGAGAVRNWLSTMVAEARVGREIVYFNGDADYNNAVHIADLTALVIGLAERTWQGADCVVLGAAGAMKVRDVVRAIVAAAGGRATAREVPPGRPPFLLSSERAVSLYGYRPQPIDAMLSQFLAESGLTAAPAAPPSRRDST